MCGTWAADFSVNMTFPYDVPTSAGSCGDYLPVDSVFNRFIWNIGFLARNGFYVLVDNRAFPRPISPSLRQCHPSTGHHRTSHC